jgi:hypothetical protein
MVNFFQTICSYATNESNFVWIKYSKEDGLIYVPLIQIEIHLYNKLDNKKFKWLRKN